MVYLYAPETEEHADMVRGLLDEMADSNSVNYLDCDIWDESTARANATPNSRFINKGTCDHCGAAFHYGAAYINSEGEYAIVGNICASNKLNLTAHQYADKKLRTVAKTAKTRAQADLAMSRLLPNRLAALNAEHHISKDIKQRFRKWRSLSVAQWTLVKKIANKKAEIEVEKASEPEPVAIPPELLEGRQEINGVLLAKKTVETYYGSTEKMLVRDNHGFKLWGTCPESLAGCNRGDKVSFFAAIQASPDDECFGFFKRPTKASFQQAGES